MTTNTAKINQFLVIVLAAVTLWGVSWLMRTSLSGVRPTKGYADVVHESTEEASDDPEIKALRDKIRKDDNDLESKKQLGTKLLAGVSDGSIPAKALVEVSRLFKEVLTASPNDTEAILGLADISFNLKFVEQANSLYKRYLNLDPSNNRIRTTYASTLTLLGKPEEAVTELKAVLKNSPNDFTALANLSITYFELGDPKNGAAVGDEALKNAPDKEAKERFGAFLAKEKSGEVRHEFNSASSSSELGVINYIKNNPIAGNKFVRYEISTDRKDLKVFLKDFPMENMPPFAREKFIGNIRENISKDGVVKVFLVDESSGRVMETVVKKE